MKINAFWQDALKFGAILGLVMGVSSIYETYELFISSRVGVSALFVVEWLVAAVLFIWLLYKFTKRCAKLSPAEVGFNYVMAFGYAMVVAVLAGVVVGVMHHIYIRIVGYDAFVDGYILLIDEYMSLIGDAGIVMPEEFYVALDEACDVVRKSEAPTMMQSIFSSLNTYMFAAFVPSLIIAAVVRRAPRQNTLSNDSNN